MSEATTATATPAKLTDLDHALGPELAAEVGALAKVGSVAIAGADRASIAVGADGMPELDTMDKQLRFCALAVRSRLVPVKTVAEAWICLMRGHELGFHGLLAFDYIYPVDGKPRLTPDGAKAKGLRSGLVEDFQEPEPTGEGDARAATVTIKRKGIATPIVRSFSIAQAKTAGLAGRQKNNWNNYPDRMLMARARGWAWGDAFRDVLAGMQVRERYDLDPGEQLGGAVDVPPRVALARADGPGLLSAITAAEPGETIDVSAEPVDVAEPQPAPDAQDGAQLEPDPTDEAAAFDASAAEDRLANAVAASVDEHERADVLRAIRPEALASQADLAAALVRLAEHPASAVKPVGQAPLFEAPAAAHRDTGARRKR